MNLARVVATLTGDQNISGRELIQIARVLDRRGIPADSRRIAAHLRCGKKHRFNVIEVALRAHAFHQHGAHHSPPPDQANIFHRYPAFNVRDTLNSQCGNHGVAHFNRADSLGAALVNICGAQTLGQHTLDRVLDAPRRLVLVEGVAQHHGR